MALNKITYDDKSNYQTSSLADIYKVTANNMNEIKTVVNGLVDSTTYDTNEIAVGAWIDGKTIYKKTFTGSLPTITQSWTTLINVSSLNISNLIDIEGMCGTGKLPRYSSSSYYIDIQLTGNGNIQVMGLGYSNQPYKITLYYTKTS